MFETIKEMYALLFEFLGEIIKFFGYAYNEENGKIEKLPEAAE